MGVIQVAQYCVLTRVSSPSFLFLFQLQGQVAWETRSLASGAPSKPELPIPSDRRHLGSWRLPPAPQEGGLPLQPYCKVHWSLYPCSRSRPQEPGLAPSSGSPGVPTKAQGVAWRASLRIVPSWQLVVRGLYVVKPPGYIYFTYRL